MLHKNIAILSKTKPRNPLNPTDSWFLLYDGNCPMCIGAVAKLTRMKLLGTVQAVDFAVYVDLPVPVWNSVKSEMVLYNAENGTSLSGVKAVLGLLEMTGRFHSLVKLSRLWGMQPLAQLVYRTIAYNRRILSPPPYRGGITCDCDPPEHKGYRLLLLIVLITGAVVGSCFFGISLHLNRPDLGLIEASLGLTLAAGLGWALNFMVFAVLLRQRFAEFWWHCLLVMNVGILWLVPIALLNLVGYSLDWELTRTVSLVGVIANSLIMLRVFQRRSKQLAFPVWTSGLWFILQQLGGIPLFLYFNLF